MSLSVLRTPVCRYATDCAIEIAPYITVSNVKSMKCANRAHNKEKNDTVDIAETQGLRLGEREGRMSVY